MRAEEAVDTAFEMSVNSPLRGYQYLRRLFHDRPNRLLRANRLLDIKRGIDPQTRNNYPTTYKSNNPNTYGKGIKK